WLVACWGQEAHWSRARSSFHRWPKFSWPAALSRSAPLDRAADARRLGSRALASARDFQHPFVELTRRIRLRPASGIVEPAAVLQLKLGVEAEEVRRADGAVRLGYRLRLVPEVGEGETHALRQRAHVVKGVLGVVRRIVAADRHRPDAVSLQLP